MKKKLVCYSVSVASTLAYKTEKQQQQKNEKQERKEYVAIIL